MGCGNSRGEEQAVEDNMQKRGLKSNYRWRARGRLKIAVHKKFSNFGPAKDSARVEGRKQKEEGGGRRRERERPLESRSYVPPGMYTRA